MATCINTQENKEEQREAPQRRAAIGEERQRNTNNGRQTQHHAYIDKDMEQEYGQHTITINSAKGLGLSLGQMDESQYQGQE